MKGDFTYSVHDRPWKQFFIGDIFTVSRPTARNKDDYSKGNIPFVASGSINNGVMKCCLPKETEKLDEGNCITVSPVDGSTFYQQTDFLGRGGAGSSILILRSENLNRERGLFLARAIQHTCSKYTYGRMGNKDGIKRERILLPVNESGNPDYAFMDEYIKERESTECWRSICSESEIQSAPDLSEKKWGRYTFDELFEIRPGKRLENRNKIPGSIPFVGASDSNNGVTGFVNNINESLDSNTLGVSYNGAPCIAFHHPYECIFTDDVKHLHLKYHDDNKYVHLFLATVIGMQKVKYSYGYKFNEQRMKKQTIMLPMTDSGNPDYEYMETYIKWKESVLLRRYCDYVKVKSSE